MQVSVVVLSRKRQEVVLTRRNSIEPNCNQAIKTRILTSHPFTSVMTVDNAESLSANSSSETRSVFYCPKSPDFIWDLSDTSWIKIILAVTTIACPFTILLNLLVIIAVKTRRELKKNSNILLSSLAVADLLVGAVSMPLSITLDALVLQRILFEDVICTIDIISKFLLYTVYNVSFLHLLLIAWERYVATVKWMKYNVIVRKERVKKYTMIAWLSAILTSVPPVVMQAVNVRYEILYLVDVILSTFWIVCFLLIAYFNIRAYLGARKRSQTQIRSVTALVKANLERKIAHTIFWLTLFAGISGLPTVVVYLFRGISPFLRESYTFRWAETTLQFNSLVNPLLYFYRSRRLRKAALELLRCRKPQRIEPEVPKVCRVMRRRFSVASPDAETLRIGQKRPRIGRSESCGAVKCWAVVPVKDRPKSAPSKVITQESNKLVVTVQIENAPRKKRIRCNTVSPKDTTELKRSRHCMTGKITRSASLDENSFVTLTTCHQNAAERNFKRSTSLPILSTN